MKHEKNPGAADRSFPDLFVVRHGMHCNSIKMPGSKDLLTLAS